MADPLSIPVSVLTLIGKVNTVWEAIQRVRQAPAELQRLSLQLEQTKPILRDLERLCDDDVPNHLSIHLRKLRQSVEKARTSLDGCCKSGGSSDETDRSVKIKWLVWVRTRKRLAGLIDDIRGRREILVMHVHMLTLERLKNVVKTTANSSTDVLALTNRVCLLQGVIEDFFAQSGTWLEDHQQSFLEHLKNIDENQGLLNVGYTQARQLCHSVAQVALNGSQCASNMELLHSSVAETAFDSFPNVYPEAYSVENEYGTAAYVASRSTIYADGVRTEQYSIHYAKNPRCWIWINVAITSNRADSQLMNAIPLGFNRKMVYAQPQAQRRLQELLCGVENMREGATLRLSVEEYEHDRVPPKLNTTSVECYDNTRSVGASLAELSRHLGCARFREMELIFRQRLRPSLFLVCTAQEQIFYQTITSDAIIAEDAIVTRVKLLHALRSSHTVLGLEGVVFDHSNTICKGYLMTCSKGKIRRLKSERGVAPYPWPRAERWARGIVEAVADVHCSGNTVGNLRMANVILAEDDYPQLFLRECQISRLNGSNSHGLLAPELRERLRTSDDVKTNVSSVQSDIFNLGMILWLLGSRNVSPLSPDYCRLSGCSFTPRIQCTAEHTNPVALPPCKDDGVPKYHQDIIAMCRRKDPRHRPAARDILSELPSRELLDLQWQEHRTKEEAEEYAQRGYDLLSNCNECGYKLAEGYLCFLCKGETGTDICHRCAKQGSRCHDRSHTLYWYKMKGFRAAMTDHHPHILGA